MKEQPNLATQARTHAFAVCPVPLHVRHELEVVELVLRDHAVLRRREQERKRVGHEEIITDGDHLDPLKHMGRRDEGDARRRSLSA